jgi:hypothetical protein
VRRDFGLDSVFAGEADIEVENRMKCKRRAKSLVSIAEFEIENSREPKSLSINCSTAGVRKIVSYIVLSH